MRSEFQQCGGADAGALQDGRRMDRARGEDHLADGARRKRLAVDLDLDAADMRPIALELELRHQGVADDREVGATARRLQVAVVGRDADPRAAVDRIGQAPVPFGRVVVLAPAVTEPDGRLFQRAIHRPPVGDGRAIDRDRPLFP